MAEQETFKETLEREGPEGELSPVELLAFQEELGDFLQLLEAEIAELEQGILMAEPAERAKMGIMLEELREEFHGLKESHDLIEEQGSDAVVTMNRHGE